MANAAKNLWGCCFGEVKSKPKEKVAESDAPKEELSRFTGGLKGFAKMIKRETPWLVGWLVIKGFFEAT